MACLFMDSFAHYTVDALGRKWDTVTATTHLFSSDLKLHPGAQQVLYLQSGASQISLTKNVTASRILVVGGYFRFTAVSVAINFIETMESTTVHAQVGMNTSGQLTVSRGGTVLATDTGHSFSANTWYHVEAKLTIGDATGNASTYGAYEVRVNGTAWLGPTTNVDTNNAGTSVANQVKIRNANGTGVYVSSFYILDTTGSVANDFLGPCRVAVLRPAGVGNYSQWTPNYAGNFVNVGEDLADDDNSFNQSSTANQIDSFPLTELPSGATVHALQYAITARQDAGAARTIAPLTRISSTDYAGTNYNTGASYSVDREVLTLSPATSAQWTVSEVNGAEFGYKLIA